MNPSKNSPPTVVHVLGLLLAAGLFFSACGDGGGGGKVTTPCNGECPVDQCIGNQCIGAPDTGDVPDTPDVPPDVPADMPPDTPDVPDAEDTDVPDVDDTDVPDGDVEDTDVPDTEDADVPTPEFEESCIFAALACHGREPIATTCTIRPEPDPLVVDVRFEDGLESRGVRPDRTYTVDVTRDGEACLTLRALESGRNPDQLDIVTPGDDGQTFRIERDFGTTTITCPDDSVEEWPEDVVSPWLPQIWSRSDDLCAEVEPPECSRDSTCLAQDGETECCLTAGTGRCTDNGTCPESFAQLVYPSESCIAETLGCFGVAREALECSINQNTDRSEYTYSGDRTTVVVGDGFDNFTLAATAEGETCFTARFQGRGGYDGLRVTNPDSGDSFDLAFEGETATVTCPDDSVEELPRLAIDQHLPEILSERHPLCEVEEFEACVDDGSCGEQQCCRTFDGDRCINVQDDECPVVEDFWRASCLYPLFECFGAGNQQAACVDFSPRDRTEVTYVSGSTSTFFDSLGEASRVTSDGDVDCFQATGDTEDGFAIQDLANGETFRISFVANNAQIVCPDDRVDLVPRATVLSYLPGRPAPQACEEPPRDDLCQENTECVDEFGEGFVCCDVGNQNRCLTEDACGRFTPRTLCDARDQCGEDEECCTIAPVRVCDPGVCGDEICCNLSAASACGTQSECRTVEDLCVLDDPESCGEGLTCCGTTQGLRCLEDECPDLEELWPDNCAYDTLNCAGDEFVLDVCLQDEELDFFDATYESGARARFFEQEGRDVLRVGFGQTQCYEATATDDGYTVVNSRTAETFTVSFDGDLARVTCPGDAVQIAQAANVRAHIPDTPRPDLCADSDQTWQSSCLFSLFECFGADRELDACVDWGAIDVVEATYDGDREVTFYPHDGRVGRLSGFSGLDCFTALEVEGGLRVTDAANGDLYRVTYEGDLARIACPNADTFEVSRETIQAYLPEVPVDVCEDAERFDQCTEDSTCRDIDDALMCCDTGDANACLPAESCRGNIPRQTCAGDDGCGDGEVCCSIEPVRVCNPQLCRGELCCNVPAAQVCATANECLGIFDDCAEEDPDSCGNAAVCCPTQNGLRCVDGNQCPEEQDPIQATCLADTLLCFGRDNELLSCVEHEGIDILVSEYDSGASASFYTQYGNPAARTNFGIADCYDFVASDDGYTLQDLSTGTVYSIEIEGDFANILCPDDTVDQALATALDRWLPVAPDRGLCEAAERDDECTDNQTCIDIDERFRCCDEGDRNSCSPADSCVRNTPRVQCQDAGNCGDGEVCCNVAPARICDPTLCGTELCCNVPDANVCASQAECNGIFDHCDVDNPEACLDGELCCETIEGNRCSPGDECEPLQDPIAATCLGDTLGCFGRNRVQDSCLSYNDVEIGLVLSEYEGDVSARFFTRYGAPARRTYTGGLGCFDAVDTDSGYDVMDVISGDEFSIAIDGETATITCPDDTTEEVLAAAVRAYFPQVPDRELCDIPDGDFSCVFDGDCEQLDPQLGCCNSGDDFTCLTAEGCFRNSERITCDGSDNGCGEGQGCCAFESARVCDPAICGDSICCNTGNQLVCADGDECRGVFDHCNERSPESCGEGALCCDTLDGSRCLVNVDDCPPVQDPIEASCLFDTFSCFGTPGDVDSCEVRTNLGYVEATYGNGGVGRFFQHLGLPSVRAENGDPCFDAVTAEDGTLLITNLLTRQEYRVNLDGDDATIVCPDDQMDIVGRTEFERYLPGQPALEDCTETDRNDVCADSEECMDLDESLRCCSAGDRNLCLTPESCYRNDARTTCALDSHCGEGTQCCNAGPVRVCNPILCGDSVCCNVNQADVCLSEQECNGVYDLCDMQNPDCGEGSQCCDTLEGARCVVGDTCPEPVDPIAQTCLADVLGCTGRNLELDSCEDYGDLDVRTATYASGAELRFYTHLGRSTRQGRFEQTLCYHAAEIGDAGGFDITDPQDQAYQVFFDGDLANIRCPDNSRQTVSRASVLAYLTAAPADEVCDPFQRDDACDDHGVCAEQNEEFICCDTGDANACLPGDGCAVNIPRATCEVNDQCSDGEVCCPQMPTRVCNPSLCGDAICCNVEAADICATQSECNGVVDVCDSDDPTSCSDATQCCGTVRGTRCLAVDECPVVDDPVLGTCLFDTLQCAGRDLDVSSCLDLGEVGLTRVRYEGDTVVSTYFQRDGVEGRRVTAGNLNCYDAVRLPADGGLTLVDLISGGTHLIEFDGDNANVTCSDQTTVTVPRDALTPYLPVRPPAEQCAEEVVDACSVNGDCAEVDATAVCCPGTDGNRCLSAATCADSQARVMCNDDAQCGDETCCEVAPTRVCDPTVCGADLCCNVPRDQVCATDAVCNGVLNHCDLQDVGSCPGNQLCCESVGGTRCLPGDTCPEPENPLIGTCLLDALECFGRDHERDTCTEWPGGDIDYVTYDGGAYTSFFTHLGLASRRSGRGEVSCFEVYDGGEEGLTFHSLADGLTHHIELVGQFARITCADDQLHSVPRPALEAYLPARPAPENCGPGDRNDLCEDDAACADIDEQLRCCDRGDGNDCLTAQGCFENGLRQVCDADAQCGEGTVCCELAPVRICNPTVCGDDICCSIPGGNVCATNDECNGIVDLCELDDPDTCLDGETCCDTLEGARCNVGVLCPEPPDPVLATCVGDVLSCFGRDRDIIECVDHGDIGVLDGTYTTGVTGRFYSHYGDDAIRAGDGDVDCYDAIATDDGYDIHNLLADEVFGIVLGPDDVTITCADDSVETVSRAAFARYLPERPNGPDCDAPVHQDACDTNSDCEELDPQLRCCPGGNGNQCLTLTGCFDSSPRETCAGDEDCGNGAFCCDRGPVRVCNPRLCDGELCCNIEDSPVCGSESECNDIFDICEPVGDLTCPNGEQCCDTSQGQRCFVGDECPVPEDPVVSTCLADAFQCFGRAGNLNACDHWDFGTTEADFEGGGRVRFYTELDAQARRSRRGEVDCFDAVGSEEDGFVISDLINDEQLTIEFEGPIARITCADDTVETVPRADALAYLPARPFPDACAPGEPVRNCADNAECRDIQSGLVCCDLGDEFSCTTAQDCFQSQPRTACEGDDNCGDGETCCGFAPARICDPAVCGDTLCCNVEQEQVCATADACRGLVDLCADDDPGSCADGELCCPTQVGDRCVVGDECPEPPDPVLDTCLAGTVNCFGRDNNAGSCVEYGETSVRDVIDDETGAIARHFSSFGVVSARTQRDGVDCFAMRTTDEGGVEIEDLNTGDSFAVSLDDNNAVILCPDDTVESVPRGALEAWLPVAPAPEDCTPADRDDACEGDNECPNGETEEVCCDLGTENGCTNFGACVENTLRSTCGGDDDCGNGDTCCALETVRVCDPDVCGGEVCCNVESVEAACGTSAECAGVVDLCDADRPSTCSEELPVCCPTSGGLRCLVGPECPEPPDPFADSCLFGTMQCQGRDLVQSSCADFEGIGIRRVAYDGNVAIDYFTNAGDPARRVNNEDGNCFESVERTAGVHELFDPEVNGTFVIDVRNQTATILCPDDTTEEFDRDVLLPYLPARPGGQCDPADRDDECVQDAECSDEDPITRCCDLGDHNICGSGETCVPNEVRTTCDDDSDCGDGTGCCTFEVARVCDPNLCNGLTCCSLPQVMACGTEAQCFGRLDFCEVGDNTSCDETTPLCCDTVQGNRCLNVDECPEPPDPLEGTCLFDTLVCMGDELEIDSCEIWDGLGIAESQYVGGARAQFFDSLGVETHRAYNSDDQHCYTARAAGEDAWTLANPATGEEFTLRFQETGVTVTCPDQLVTVLPSEAVTRYLTVAPDPDTCDPAQRDDQCQNDGECQQIDPTLRCCDGGNGNLCGTGETCVQQAVHVACADDDGCGDGTQCCGFAAVRVCDPELCEGALCCELSRDACGTNDECNGVFDFCDLQDDSTCGDGIVCCPTVGGARCIGGDECPPEPDPLEGSCLYDTLACVGLDRTVDSCTNWADIGLVQANYPDGGQLQYYETFGERQWRGANGAECFDALETVIACDRINDPECEDTDVLRIRNLITEEEFVVEVADNLATITCPGDEDLQELVPLAAVTSYLGDAPNGCQAPVRDNECAADADCRQNNPNDFCCDQGDRNTCGLYDNCVGTEVRPTCLGNDDCGQGTMCCVLDESRVCNPTLCDGDLCCAQEEISVCATAEECGGIVDLCRTNDPTTCTIEDTQCCETLGGNRCLPGECPVLPDEITFSCLGVLLDCFGRDLEADSCTSYRDDELLRAEYGEDIASLHFSRYGRDVVRTQNQGDCYEVVGTDDPTAFVLNDLRDVGEFTLQIGPEVTIIGCADGSSDTVPTEQVNSFLPPDPDVRDCDPFDGQDECEDDAGCVGETRCCDTGLTNACLAWDNCVPVLPRTVCEDSDICGNGEQCCPLSDISVCDPGLCGDAICCILNQSQNVCGTQAECNGVFDECDPDLNDCPNGNLCCESEDGARCRAEQECPQPEDQVQDTCLWAALSCFGRFNELNVCEHWDNLDITTATYENGARAQYYQDAGRPARYVTDGEFGCFQAVTLEDGAVELVSIVEEGASYRIDFGETLDSITCPDGQGVQQIPSGNLAAYLIDGPAPEQCEAAVRNDVCEDDDTCRQDGREMTCCDAGDGNVCGNGQTCYDDMPRTRCSDGANCGDGSVCCAIDAVRICDPGICGGNLCCGVETAQVCATPEQCEGVVDLCDINDGNTCALEQECCSTSQGARCLAVETCPEPEDPIVQSCIGDVLFCAGDDNELESCSEHSGIGVTEVLYSSGVSSTYFSRYGQGVRRTSFEDSPCFDAVETGDGFAVTDLREGESYTIVFDAENARVTCPDDSVETLPRARVEEFFPAVPDNCGDAERADLCVSDAQCQQGLPGSVCCDLGAASECLPALECEARAVHTVCQDDGHCGDGLSCCGGGSTRVCDPALCGGELCCDLEVTTCELREGECALADSCISATLGCVGQAAEVASCEWAEQQGIISADYDNGANAFYYTRLGRPARITQRSGVSCFRAVHDEDAGQFLVTDLQSDAMYVVTLDGDQVQVECPDNVVQTLPASTVLPVLSDPPPTDECTPTEREDACVDGSDCVDDGFGDGALCCDGGNANFCVEANPDGCDYASPRELCGLNADCGQDEGCCEVEDVRVCDPEICGDLVCCFAPSARVCDGSCGVCQENEDCDPGDVCCEFTNTCTSPEECVGDGTCDSDADCFVGTTCCKVGVIDVCTAPLDCPTPCRSEGDCSEGRVCCGSQADPFGAYCGLPDDCAPVAEENCALDADCGQGQICCRTQDVPSCSAPEACDVACVEDSDCGLGQECCGGATRTPICVDSGTCGKARGATCADNNECSPGLSCCNYDSLGRICIDTELCGGQIPPDACADDPTACNAYPLAVCCEVDGTAICTDEEACANPTFVCDQDTECGLAGSACCFDQVDPFCYSWRELQVCGGEE